MHITHLTLVSLTNADDGFAVLPVFLG
jgi:hypothetical protein